MKKLQINDILETQRCIMKIPQESEAEYMWNLITENTTKYMIWKKWDDFTTTLGNIKKTIKNASNWISWDAAIYDKKTGEMIGRCWMNRVEEEIPLFELWYWITEDHYGKWIIPECVNKLLQFAFEESSFEKWVIRCDSKNINSEKVALKCWFKFEWEFKNHERVHGKLRNTKFFWITREQYLNR